MTTESVTLGATKMVVPALGVGTNRWGAGRSPRPELAPVFRAAIEEGVALFDSAEVYGMGGSERTLGLCLREGAGEGAGERPFIISKFFPMPWRLGRRSMIEALKRSLRRLGLERLDLYLLHFPMPPLPLRTWALSLADAWEAGLTRSVGISNCSIRQMEQARETLARRGVPLACNEVEYSLLSRGAEKSGLLAECRRNDITLLAYRPLALGLLPGKHDRTHPPAGWRGSYFRRTYPPEAAELSALLSRIGEAHGGRSVGQVALNWVLRKGALPIPGATSAAHVAENAGALGWRLTEEEVEELDSASDRTVSRR